MFNSKLHFLFSVRKKYAEKFGKKLDYRFFNTASHNYTDKATMDLFFEAISVCEKDDLLDFLLSKGIQIQEEKEYPDRVWDFFWKSRSNHIALLYDEEGRYVGQSDVSSGIEAFKKQFIKKNCIWMYIVHNKDRRKIDTEKKRDKFVSEGKADGPFEIWFDWLRMIIR